eukprot:CAMPEP_0206474550 /NCGR_PEP_ID=MMETSP0324_2-20121206/33548_1 /ASSEMBLY_ACC=CAM_ASM_000836 /TAXON_ID=2866 /ORGANISM="Crypthecodinium cohnii, Strain Seligo" /LENGTH=125 /DNA_ID=CAMNT_0053949733 /DNA_START=21 /DNA_END=398 /DNA_ORIENTATION=+
MFNRGPAKWREWRLGNMAIPLYLEDPKTATEGQKSVVEVAHATISALRAKGAEKALLEALDVLVKEPDSPTGRCSEQRFRTTLKQVAAANMEQEELEEIFPVVLETRTNSKPSKNSRKPSKESVG